MSGARQAGRDEDTAVDRLADVLVRVVDVRVAHDADRRPSREELALERGEPHQRLVRRRRLEMRILVVVAIHQRMLVAVDEARHQRPARQLDHLRAGGNRRPVAHGDDAFAVDDDDHAGARIFADAVDHAVRDERDRLAQGLPAGEEGGDDQDHGIAH